jgi:3-oxoadipate enol-lactonase
MPIVQVNDIHLYYETYGQGEPLVLIAGFSADHTAWQEVVDKFKNNFQVIVFDNRGAGQSDIPPGPYTIETLCKDVVSLCDQLEIQQAHFVGNSMGGFMVQYLAGKFPERVKTATISNSTYGPEHAFNLYLDIQLELIKAGTPFELVVKSSCTWVYSYDFLMNKGKFQDVVKLALNNPYPFTLEGYENQHHALKNFNSKAWLGTIKSPTLVIGSDEDLIFPVAAIRALTDYIPNSNYIEFKRCGHLPMVEYPEQFVKVVKEFIGGS